MIQPLYLAAQATADSNGLATFVFSACPQGLVQTGSLAVQSAPAAALFTALVGVPSAGLPWGQWQGNGTFGPVQVRGLLTLTITATGLTAGTTYQAVWIGDACYEWEAVPVSPSALATAATISGGTVSRTFTADTSDGYINSVSAIYPTMAAGAGLTVDTTSATVLVGQSLNFQGYEGFYGFDTSAIPDSATILSAALAVAISTVDVGGSTFTLLASLFDWGTTVTTADWQAFSALSALTSAASLASSAFTVGTRQNMAAAAGLALGINKTGFTRLIMFTDREAAQNVPTGTEFCRISSAEAAANLQPQLTVVSSA